MSTLHERLIAAMDDEATGINYWVNANPFEDAVRGVVERHRPVPCAFERCATPDHQLCAACGRGCEYPSGCPDTVAIAAALGVDIEETPK